MTASTTPGAPVVVTAVFTPNPGALDQVIDVLSRAVAAVHSEPGCLLYALHRDPDGRLVLIEKWESTALLDAHGSAAAVGALNREIDGLLAEPAVVTRLAPLPAGTAAQGQL